MTNKHKEAKGRKAKKQPTKTKVRKFKVGDRVKIVKPKKFPGKTLLGNPTSKDGLAWIPEMDKYNGKVVTISGICGDRRIETKEIGWWVFAPEWVKLVSKSKKTVKEQKPEGKELTPETVKVAVREAFEGLTFKTRVETEIDYSRHQFVETLITIVLSSGIGYLLGRYL